MKRKNENKSRDAARVLRLRRRGHARMEAVVGSRLRAPRIRVMHL